MSKKSVWLTVGTVLLLAMMMVMPVLGASVTPELVEGNPTCQELGYAFGFRINTDPATGSYTDPVTGVTIQITNNTLGDGYLDAWAATLNGQPFGIDAVTMKGGPNANVYRYNPEVTSDTNLVTPIGAGPGGTQPYGISHIDFCFDFEVDVTKTATTTYTRTYDWTITKGPDANYTGFTGDSFVHEYTVEVEKSQPVDSDWAVNGNITIANNTPFAATITGVSDVISPDIAATVDCGVTFPHELAAGQSLQCTYGPQALPNANARTNTATATTTGIVGGDSGTADVIFGAPTTVVNDSINVEDTNGDSWVFNDSDSVSYTKTFTCDADEGQHINTATIVETGQSDTATVNVACYELQVTKDADTSLTRTWDWTIDKSADQSDLLLSEGQLFQVNYEVVVDASSVDSDWAVSGNITVDNPAPIDAVINSVSDIVSPAIAATVDCGVTFPYTLAAGGTLNCTYSADLPDDADRTNTATATLQNYDYDKEGVATAAGTTDFSHTVNVSFANATVTEIDECVDVNDTNVGFLGTVCAADAPKTFEYTLWFGAHPDADVVLECGENSHTNIADFVTNDTGATGSDEWTVNANVSCDLGCTLTQGYWKTHSEKGPAPYDDTWAQLPDGADTDFFNSGQTWYEVFWTAPGGNVYYNLAHQYMAAKLNVLNGASAPQEVLDALDAAEDLFNTYTPAEVAALKANNATRKLFISLASTLDQYNNGLIGPGHCSESNGYRVASSTARESFRLGVLASRLGLSDGPKQSYGMLLRRLR